MDNIQKTVLAALCTVLIIIGAYIAIPVGIVPIVLQNMFVLIAGLLLGPAWGTVSVVVYLFLGALGLPVFAGGKGGFVHILGPTGGYLLSYVPAVFACGLVASRERLGRYTDFAAVMCGMIIIYAVGLPWLKFNLDLTWTKAFSIGMLPFLPGAVLKVIAAVLLAKAVRPIIERLLAGRS